MESVGLKARTVVCETPGCGATLNQRVSQHA